MMVQDVEVTHIEDDQLDSQEQPITLHRNEQQELYQDITAASFSTEKSVQPNTTVTTKIAHSINTDTHRNGVDSTDRKKKHDSTRSICK